MSDSGQYEYLSEITGEQTDDVSEAIFWHSECDDTVKRRPIGSSGEFARFRFSDLEASERESLDAFRKSVQSLNQRLSVLEMIECWNSEYRQKFIKRISENLSELRVLFDKFCFQEMEY